MSRRRDTQRNKRFLSPAHTLHVVQHERALIMCDLLRDDVHLITDSAADLWILLSSSDGEVRGLPESYQSDLDALLDAGLVRFHSTQREWPEPKMATTPPASWGSSELQMSTGKRQGLSLFSHVWIGAFLLFSRLLVWTLGTSRCFTLLTILARSVNTRWSGRDDLEATLRKVRTVGTSLPIRAACFEQTLCCSILCLSKRRAVTARIGIGVAPLQFHSWVCDAAGKPILEEPNVEHFVILSEVNSLSIRGASD